MKKDKVKKPKKEHRIDPKSFYNDINGIYHIDPKKKKLNISDKIKEPPKSVEKVISREEAIPKPFDQKEYKKKSNKNLEYLGAGVKIYDKNSINLLIAILIGVIIVFGLFFVWSISNDKFKTDFECPDCKCEQADLHCPDINLSQVDASCICESANLTCPEVNFTPLITAINNLNFTVHSN